jgi:hypothetical protein
MSYIKSCPSSWAVTTFYCVPIGPAKPLTVPRTIFPHIITHKLLVHGIFSCVFFIFPLTPGSQTLPGYSIPIVCGVEKNSLRPPGWAWSGFTTYLYRLFRLFSAKSSPILAFPLSFHLSLSPFCLSIYLSLSRRVFGTCDNVIPSHSMSLI